MERDRPCAIDRVSGLGRPRALEGAREREVERAALAREQIVNDRFA